jgi:hypothetical protein
MRLVAIALCIMLLPTLVAAQYAPPAASGNAFNWSAGNLTAATRGTGPIAFASDGTVLYNSPSSFKTAGGATIPVNVTGAVSRPNAAAAIGRFAAKAAFPLTVGFALYDLAKELGYTPFDKPSGERVYLKETQGSDCDYSGGGRSGITGSGSTTSYGDAKLQLCPDSRYVCRESVTYPTPTSCSMEITPIFQGTAQNTFVWATKEKTGSSTTQEKTRQQFIDDIAAKSGWPSTSAIGRALDQAIQAGETVAIQPTTVTGPATSPGSQTVINNSNTTTTQNTTNNYQYDGPKVTITTTTSSNVTNNTTGQQAEGTTTTTTVVTPELPQEPKPAEKVITCGLPDTPACKIDETGMPDQAQIDSAMDRTKGTKIYKDIEDMAANPEQKLPAHPVINWAFVLPTGCAVIPLPAFAPIIPQVDVCQFQPMFHDLMSIVWLLGGIFGAISLFMKNALSH